MIEILLYFFNCSAPYIGEKKRAIAKDYQLIKFALEKPN
jgi:hypothetical protein